MLIIDDTFRSYGVPAHRNFSNCDVGIDDLTLIPSPGSKCSHEMTFCLPKENLSTLSLVKNVGVISIRREFPSSVILKGMRRSSLFISALPEFHMVTLAAYTLSSIGCQCASSTVRGKAVTLPGDVTLFLSNT